MTQDLRVRLDKWLWAARFFKTRSLASQAIDLGRVRIEGERIKPAREARVGETLDIQAGEQRFTVQVLALSAQRGPAPVARLLYQESPESLLRRQRLSEQRATEPARTLKGRPTKRDRRELSRASGDPSV
jgi:ribosome-associated heat shock protein Hsp15